MMRRASTAPVPNKYIVCTETFKVVHMSKYFRQDIYQSQQFDTPEQAALHIPATIANVRRSHEIQMEKAMLAIKAIDQLVEARK